MIHSCHLLTQSFQTVLTALCFYKANVETLQRSWICFPLLAISRLKKRNESSRILLNEINGLVDMEVLFHLFFFFLSCFINRSAFNLNWIYLCKFVQHIANFKARKITRNYLSSVRQTLRVLRHISSSLINHFWQTLNQLFICKLLYDLLRQYTGVPFTTTTR